MEAADERKATSRPPGSPLRPSATIALASVAYLLVLGLLWPIHGRMLTWDEVDYVDAGKLGLVSNALERGSLTPTEFIAFARAKRAGTNPPMPGDYDEAIDPLVRRHHHPPFLAYLLATVPSGASERTLRIVQLCAAAALLVAMLLGYRILSPGASLSGTVLVCILWASLALAACRTLSCHAWMAVFSTTAAFSCAAWLSTGKRSWAIVLVAAIAMGALALQTGAFVLFFIACALIVWRPGPAWARMGILVQGLRGAAIVSAIVFCLWPGILLKASVLKIAALYVYLILKGSEYAAAEGQAQYLLRALLPAVVLGTVGLVALIASARNRARLWGPVAVLGSGYTLLLMKVAIFPTYLVPGLAPLALLPALWLDLRPTAWHRVVAIGAAVVTLALATPASADESFDDVAARADFAWLRTETRARVVLADGAHVVRHYLGSGYDVRPVVLDYQESELLVRRAGRYEPVTPEEVRGNLVLILAKRHRFAMGRAARELLAGCRETPRPTFSLFYCP